MGWLACACATHAIYVSLIKELEGEKINKRMRAIKFHSPLSYFYFAGCFSVAPVPL